MKASRTHIVNLYAANEVSSLIYMLRMLNLNVANVKFKCRIFITIIVAIFIIVHYRIFIIVHIDMNYNEYTIMNYNEYSNYNGYEYATFKFNIRSI
jgi:hypothetical protein